MRAVAVVLSMMTCGVCVTYAAVPPAPRWDDEDISDLLASVGLLPASGVVVDDFAVDELEREWRTGDRNSVDGLADLLFAEIAATLQSGSVAPTRRVRWRIDGPPVDVVAITLAREAALANDAIQETLAQFEPPHPEYRALKEALAVASDDTLRRKLQANLERWRWMPRDLGSDYVFVNVPAYEAIVVRNGAEVWRSRVIVGAKKTPTWQFAATVEGVAFNPTWFVPTSIVAESVGDLLREKPAEAARLGYYVAEDGGVRQKPGPRNALGEVKLMMPNPFGVYLHDTPFKAFFDKDRRALSHGCIRVEDPLGLAAAVLGPRWTRETIEGIVATSETATIDLETPIPVYIAYFTAAVGEKGDVTFYPDIYGLDKSVKQADAAAAGELNSDVGCPPA